MANKLQVSHFHRKYEIIYRRLLCIPTQSVTGFDLRVFQFFRVDERQRYPPFLLVNGSDVKHRNGMNCLLIIMLL